MFSRTVLLLTWTAFLCQSSKVPPLRSLKGIKDIDLDFHSTPYQYQFLEPLLSCCYYIIPRQKSSQGRKCSFALEPQRDRTHHVRRSTTAGAQGWQITFLSTHHKQGGRTGKPQSPPPGYTSTAKAVPGKLHYVPEQYLKLGTMYSKREPMGDISPPNHYGGCGGLSWCWEFFSPFLPSLFFLRKDLSVRAGAHQYGYPASPGVTCHHSQMLALQVGCRSHSACMHVL